MNSLGQHFLFPSSHRELWAGLSYTQGHSWAKRGHATLGVLLLYHKGLRASLGQCPFCKQDWGLSSVGPYHPDAPARSHFLCVRSSFLECGSRVLSSGWDSRKALRVDLAMALTGAKAWLPEFSTRWTLGFLQSPGPLCCG
jgi:hypothetical protein